MVSQRRRVGSPTGGMQSSSDVPVAIAVSAASKVAWSTTMSTTGSGALPPGGAPAAAMKMAWSASIRRCAAVRARSDGVAPSPSRPRASSQSAWNSASQNRSRILPHRRTLGNTALTIDRVAVADAFDRGVAGGVGLLVAAMGAVGVGERFPAIDEQAELVEAQRLGVLQHDVGTVGELVAATRVGPRPGQLAHLGDPDRAGGEGARRRRRGPTAAAPCGCDGWSRHRTSSPSPGTSRARCDARRPPTRRAGRPLRQPTTMACSTRRSSRSSCCNRSANSRSSSACEAAVGAEAVGIIEVGGTGIGQRRTDLGTHLRGRTHVPIMTGGCNSRGPRRDDQLGGCDSSRSTA